jgi:hypothetical protein
MGRIIPSFRTVLEMEKEEWKPFRNALSKSDRKQFDKMWDIPRLYASACSNSCQLVPLHPIFISILFHHYKELKECILEVKQLEGKVKSSSSKNKEELMIKKEEAAPATTTLDVYFFIQNGATFKSTMSY